MSVWADLSRFLSSVVGDVFERVVEQIRTAYQENSRKRKQVAFSVAIIALSAKMAKADGIVTENEVAAFRQIFFIPEREFANVSRLYNLARQDIAGFQSYAAQVRSLFPGDDPTDKEILRDVIDALFHIAKADNVIHESELEFLEIVAAVFGFAQTDFERIRSRHIEGEGADPYKILGAQPCWNYEKIKAQYRKRVQESHPDRFIARGVPQEFVTIANDRLAAINEAWNAIEKLHRPQLTNNNMSYA